MADSQCQETVWLRFSDRPNATEEQMRERKAYEVVSEGLTTVKGSVLDPGDGQQGSMAVSRAPDVVGRIVMLPTSVGDEIRVTIASDLCPR